MGLLFPQLELLGFVLYKFCFLNETAFEERVQQLISLEATPQDHRGLSLGHRTVTWRWYAEMEKD